MACPGCALYFRPGASSSMEVEENKLQVGKNQIPAESDGISDECYECLRVLISDCSVLDLLLKKLSVNGELQIVQVS